MKTIIAGSRTIRHLGTVSEAIRASGWEEEISEVVNGCAGGVDRLGRRWAELAHIPARDFPADWERHGKAAGPRRNEQMAAYADALIAVWDGESRGTADMIRRAKAHGLRVYVHRVDLDASQSDSPLIAAARLLEHRAWLRAARAAPIPPARVPYVALSLDDHAAAVDAALAAGRTSLQEWKERSMPTIRVTDGAPAEPAQSPRCTCAVCQRYAPRALAGHAVCTDCAGNESAARDILDARRRRVLNALVGPQAEHDAAHAALDDAERERWRAICQARLAVGRVGRWAGTADDATRRRLRRTQEAIDAGDPRISEPLRRMWHADEALFWASEVAADEGRRVEVAAAQFEACLEVLWNESQARRAAQVAAVERLAREGR